MVIKNVLGICTEEFWIRADFLHKIRSKKGMQYVKAARSI